MKLFISILTDDLNKNIISISFISFKNKNNKENIYHYEFNEIENLTNKDILNNLTLLSENEYNEIRPLDNNENAYFYKNTEEKCFSHIINDLINIVNDCEENINIVVCSNTSIIALSLFILKLMSYDIKKEIINRIDLYQCEFFSKLVSLINDKDRNFIMKNFIDNNDYKFNTAVAVQTTFSISKSLNCL